MKTKLLYVHNGIFPANSANRTQVINMCNEFSKKIKTTLLAFGKSKKEIKDFYKINNRLRINIVKPRGNYYLRSIILFLKFLTLKKEFNIIFTRDLLFAYLTKLFYKNKKVIYELHEIPEKNLWEKLFKKTSTCTMGNYYWA